ncbi:MAG TPA: MarR family winged helix-turn-helix transcriptional regulator, partial [Ornithinibacter sp.]|nr:MarR family winged helix-turn-helix transcriptional regulator [Ornithinibacter sp.]
VAMRLGELMAAVRSTFVEHEWGGLRPSHVRVLSAVPDGGCTVTTLAGLVGMTKQGCGQFVTVLVESGHLAESRASPDRRVRWVTRTARGDATLIRFAAVMATLEERWRDAVGSRRYAVFRAVLDELSGGTAGSVGASPHG